MIPKLKPTNLPARQVEIMRRLDQTDMEADDAAYVAWMLHAQFAAIMMILPETQDDDDDVSEASLVAREAARNGRAMAEMLALFLGGNSTITLPGSDRATLGGGGAPSPIKQSQIADEFASIRMSYYQTVQAAELLMRTIDAADLKRVLSGQREAIADAMLEMEGHVRVAREEFVGEESA